VTEPRLSEKVEPLLGEIRTSATLDLFVMFRLEKIVGAIVEHVEAIENIVPSEVVTEIETEKGPPGPTTFGASP
jgi:hypothetical protein